MSTAILALMQILSPQASQGMGTGQGALQPTASSLFTSAMLADDPALFRAKLEEAATKLAQSPADAKGQPVLPGWLSALQQAWGIEVSPSVVKPDVQAVNVASLATPGLLVTDAAVDGDATSQALPITTQDSRFEQLDIAGLFAFLSGKLAEQQAHQAGDADQDGEPDTTTAASNLAMPVWWQMQPAPLQDIRAAFAEFAAAVNGVDASANAAAMPAISPVMPSDNLTPAAIAQLPQDSQMQAFAAWLPPVRQPMDAAKSSTVLSSNTGVDISADATADAASLTDIPADIQAIMAALAVSDDTAGVSVHGAGQPLPLVPLGGAIASVNGASTQAASVQGGDQADMLPLTALRQAANDMAGNMDSGQTAADVSFDADTLSPTHADHSADPLASSADHVTMHAATTHTTTTATPQHTPDVPQRVIPVPIADQVQVHIRQAMKDGHDKVTVQLDPEDLGRIQVTMDFGKDGTHIHIVAEKQETIDLLQKDARDLARNLQQAGIRTDMSQLNFSLRQDQGGYAQGQQQSKGGFSRNWQDGEDDMAVQADIGSAMARARWTTKALDIEV
ncbi:hypothetical protein GC177_07045 [bacterium]|nr:hypothetical protein [bacterium]